MANTPEPDTHCPVCGYELGLPAWEGHRPSWETCPACGTTFGLDDDVSENPAVRAQFYSLLRSRWVAEGTPWSSNTRRPLPRATLLANLQARDPAGVWRDRARFLDTARAFLDGELTVPAAMGVLTPLRFHAGETGLLSRELLLALTAVESELDEFGFMPLDRVFARDGIASNRKALAVHQDLEAACRRILAELEPDATD